MKRGTPDHPKVAELAALLNIEHYAAVGILELLWHFTARYAPQGDIGKYSDKAIARAVGWKRPTGERGVTPECRLSEALVTAKWLDRCPCHRLVVHDWPDHADQQVTRKMARQRLAFVHPKASRKLAVPEPMPYPGPNPLAMSQDFLIKKETATSTSSKDVPAEKTHADDDVDRISFQETIRTIRMHYPSAGAALIGKIIRQCEIRADNIAQPVIPLTDALIAQAIDQCRADSPRQESAGLFIRTVPECIGWWMLHGRDSPPKKPVSKHDEKMARAMEIVEARAAKV